MVSARAVSALYLLHYDKLLLTGGARRMHTNTQIQEGNVLINCFLTRGSSLEMKGAAAYHFITRNLLCFVVSPPARRLSFLFHFFFTFCLCEQEGKCDQVHGGDGVVA